MKETYIHKDHVFVVYSDGVEETRLSGKSTDLIRCQSKTGAVYVAAQLSSFEPHEVASMSRIAKKASWGELYNFSYSYIRNCLDELIENSVARAQIRNDDSMKVYHAYMNASDEEFYIVLDSFSEVLADKLEEGEPLMNALDRFKSEICGVVDAILDSERVISIHG